MRKWAVLIFVGLVVAGSALAFAMGDGRVSGAWRYKMTVTVETPEGAKSSFAVREVLNSKSLMGLDCPECGNPPDLRGEAVVVELGVRGVLFALLKGKMRGNDHAKSLVYHVFPYDGGYGTAEGIRHYSDLKEAKAVLTPDQYPMLVMFRDVNDPKTVTEVDPGNLAAAFGEGVKLKEIRIEMTDEPVTWGIEKWLGWLPKRKDAKGYLGSEKENPYQDPTGTYLSGTEFSTGKFWLVINEGK